MKRYGVYLFDFDYTLADSSRGIVMCFRHVLERHGYKGIDDHAIKRTIGKTLEEQHTAFPRDGAGAVCTKGTRRTDRHNIDKIPLPHNGVRGQCAAARHIRHCDRMRGCTRT